MVGRLDAWRGECVCWLFVSSSLGLREINPRQRPPAYRLTGFTPRQRPSRSTSNLQTTHTLNQPTMHLIIHPFNHPSVHSPTHSFPPLFIQPPFHSSTISPSIHHSSIHSPIQTTLYPSIRPSILPFKLPFNHPSKQPSIYPLIHPRIHPSTQMQPYSIRQTAKSSPPTTGLVAIETQ